MSDISSDRILAMLANAMGPTIGALLNDPDVTDLMKNADGTVWIKRLRQSKHINTGYIMDANMAAQVIVLVASIAGTDCNLKTPRVSAELPGSGSRFQGTMPPVTATPTFAIRKKALLIFSLDDYVEQKILTPKQQDRIVQAVYNHENILIGGGTGSGKTTFANAVLKKIAETGDRILLLEDTLELQCSAENKVEMRTSDFVTMDDLIKDALRYFPKRIVVGEVRGKEALALIDIWGTGHPGGLCTIHCNSARNGLSRIERLIKRVSQDSQREAIAETVNLIVYIEECREGRRIREILEVNGYDGSNYLLDAV